MPGVVQFEGDLRGVFIGQGQLDDQGAIDVTDAVVLKIVEPTPRRHYHTYGDVYVDVKTRKLYMWSRFDSDECWMRIDLAGDDCGTIIQHLEPDDLVGLGAASLMPFEKSDPKALAWDRSPAPSLSGLTA
jgi:hypothetical protein